MAETQEQQPKKIDNNNNNYALTCSRDDTKPGVECLTIELNDKDTRESVLSKALALNKRLLEKYDWLEKADQMLDKCIDGRHTWVSKGEFLDRVHQEVEPETKDAEEILKIIENEIGSSIYENKEEMFRSLFLEQERYKSIYERARSRDVDQKLHKQILAVNECNKNHRATTKEFGEQLLSLKTDYGNHLQREIQLVTDNQQLVKEKEDLHRRLNEQFEITNTKLQHDLDSFKNYKKMLSRQKKNLLVETTTTRSTQTSTGDESKSNGWYTEPPTIDKDIADDLRELDDTGDEEGKEKSTKKKKRGRKRRNRKQIVPVNANGSTDCEEQIKTTTTTTETKQVDKIIDGSNDEIPKESASVESVKEKDDNDESNAFEEPKETVPRKSFSKIFSCWNYSNNQEMSNRPTQYSLWG